MATASTSSRRILVAEEDHDLREIITAFLEAKGWSVITLESGSALERVCSGLTIAVLDVRSVGTAGFKAFEKLRGVDPRLPVVVIASFGDAFVVKRARQLGAACVLEKPFDLEELENALMECCASLQH